MLDTRPAATTTAPRAPLLERPLGELLLALADGDAALGDGSLTAVAAATSAGRLVAACSELADRPECAPRILELASLLARSRHLQQRLATLVDEVAQAEIALVEARGLPARDARDSTGRRAAIQVALKRVLDRRLGVATVAAELVRLAREADRVAGGEPAVSTQLAETLASAALSSALQSVEHELAGVEEPWLRDYVASEIDRLRRAERALGGLGRIGW